MENKYKRRPRRYTVKEAAELMGFSESFVRDLIDNGEIGHIRRRTKSGSAYRIRGSDIERWEEENSICPEVNKNSQDTNSCESQEEILGTLRGQRTEDLGGFQRARRMRALRDEPSPNL